MANCSFLFLTPAHSICRQIFRRWRSGLLLLFALALGLPLPLRAEIALISRTVDGAPAPRASYQPAISGDERYTAFVSDADNLVLGDPGNWYFGIDSDVFVYDRETGAIENASAALNKEGIWYLKTVCRDPAIDSVGRFVAFECFSGWHFAHNMKFDIYLHDRQLQSLVKITGGRNGSLANGGSTGAALSSDGRYLAFSSVASNLSAQDTDTLEDIYLYDRTAGTFDLASVASGDGKGNGKSSAPVLSADGRYIAFVSTATNLAPGAGGDAAIYLRDRQSATTEKIVLPAGTSGPCGEPTISGDGDKLVFTVAAADGMKTIFLAERSSGSVRPLFTGAAPSLSADGRYLAFAAKWRRLPARSRGGTQRTPQPESFRRAGGCSQQCPERQRPWRRSRLRLRRR